MIVIVNCVWSQLSVDSLDAGVREGRGLRLRIVGAGEGDGVVTSTWIVDWICLPVIIELVRTKTFVHIFTVRVDNMIEVEEIWKR